MSQLIRYGIPPEVIDLWRRRESEDLLPLQERAVKQYDIFGTPNLLIQAPTSSGKTFVGEMAAVETALRRRRAVYLVPLRALADEKFRDFRAKYESYGLKVIVSSREHQEFDADLESGDFSIAVVVYEKLAHLLVRRPERLQDIDLVLADELELLSDPERGAAVELLLTRIRRAGTRLIGLSAVIGEADRLASWMNARLLQHDQRPVELRSGVLHDGRFRYRAYNEHGEGVETLECAECESNWEVLCRNIERFSAEGESTLVFVKAKHEAQRGARLIASRVDTPAAASAIEALRDLESTRSRNTLLETLGSGVAFHSADLTPAERRVVEQGIREGEIRVAICTSTLAAGMNFPARNVFITTEKWRYDNRFGVPWKTPISRADYENMSGRAGRLGSGEPFGRSILIASSPFDEETLWRRYIEGERDRVEPQLNRDPLEDHVLSLVASKVCVRESDLIAFLEDTLTGHWHWRATCPLEEIAAKVRAAVYRAADAGMIDQSDCEVLAATPIGHTVATRGIRIETARAMETWMANAEPQDWSVADLIARAAMTVDGRLYGVALTAQEIEYGGYGEALRQSCIEAPCPEPASAAHPYGTAPAQPYEGLRAAKIALMLTQWIQEDAAPRIEEQFRVTKGQLIAAAEQIGWIVDAVAGIAQSQGARRDFVGRLSTVAQQLRYGCSERMVDVASIRDVELCRESLIGLAALDIDSRRKLAEADTRTLRKAVSSDEIRQIRAWARASGGDVSATPPVSGSVSPGEPVLEVDMRHPDRLFIEGEAIQVQEKQFLLMETLAAHPGECVPYDRIYDRVWGDVVVENNQMHFQKRKLLDRIRASKPHYAKLVRTIPKRGFVLDLDPSQVRVDGDGLSSGVCVEQQEKLLSGIG